MKPQIFISYRREDSQSSAGRIYDRLRNHFEKNQIFIDVDNIEAGKDFVEALEEAVGGCNVLLAIIGKSWLATADEKGKRRLNNSKDFVRIEIRAAISRNIKVIPVLVEGASMPKAIDLPKDLKSLSRRNSIAISHVHFDSDVAILIKSLQKSLTHIDEYFESKKGKENLNDKKDPIVVTEEEKKTIIVEKDLVQPQTKNKNNEGEFKKIREDAELKPIEKQIEKNINAGNAPYKGKRIPNRSFYIAIGIALLLTVSIYAYQFNSRKNTEQKVWDVAQTKNDSAAYLRYIKSYPNGENIRIAKKKMAEITSATKLSRNKLNDSLKWVDALSKNDSTTYSNYIFNFPNGLSSVAAKQKLDSLLINKKTSLITKKESQEVVFDDQEWKVAKGLNTLASYKSYQFKLSNGKYYNAAQSRIDSLNNRKSSEPILFDVKEWRIAKELNSLAS